MQFGVIPAGLTAASAQLTPYANLKRQQPLPSAKQPLVVFRGVTAGGKSATFTLVGEAILRGGAKCLPSASQCQAIDLKTGQTEELEYLPPTGAAVTYELQLVDITSTKATASAARSAFPRRIEGRTPTAATDRSRCAAGPALLAGEGRARAHTAPGIRRARPRRAVALAPLAPQALGAGFGVAGRSCALTGIPRSSRQ